MLHPEKKHIITIAGRPGSGKSSTAKKVAEKLGYTHFSSGGLFRSLAEERGVDVMQANLSAEENKELDLLVDGKLQDIGHSEDNLVIDSRTAWHWIPSSFKVFLDLDLEIAAVRILENLDHGRLSSETVHEDNHEYARALQKRLASESRRYKSLYQINPYDMRNYDLVIDTERNSLSAVVKMVLDEYHKWLSEGSVDNS